MKITHAVQMQPNAQITQQMIKPRLAATTELDVYTSPQLTQYRSSYMDVVGGHTSSRVNSSRCGIIESNDASAKQMPSRVANSVGNNTKTWSSLSAAIAKGEDSLVATDED